METGNEDVIVMGIMLKEQGKRMWEVMGAWMGSFPCFLKTLSVHHLGMVVVHPRPHL